MAEGHFSPNTADGTSPSFHAHLDPLSFTAFRLEHATEPHLHYTTRRVFIGPTPINWLKSHRSTWSKQRIRTASTGRGITFTPDTDVSDRRRVTQLDVGPTNGSIRKRGRGDHVRKRKPNTPTSETSSFIGTSSRDASTQRATTNGRDSDSVAIEDSSETAVEEEIPVITDHANLQPLTNGDSSRRDDRSGRESTLPDFVTAKSTVRDISPITRRTGRTDTFQTARTTLSDDSDDDGRISPTFPSSPPSPLSPPAINIRPPTAPDLPPRPESVINREALDELPTIAPEDLNQGPASVTSDGLAGRSLLTNSAASLLESHNHDNTTRSTVRPKLAPLLSPPMKSAMRRHTRGQSGAANGMVRFNTHGDEAGPPIVTEPVALKKRRSLRKANKHTQGEILKISKMLIRIEVTRADLTDDFDENEAAALQTRVLEKWKEYVVVCRDAGDQEEDVEVKLQLYSNRKIPAKDTKGSWMVLGGGPAKEIMLNRRNTRVNMYSTLDKTLVIYHPHKLGNVFYVLRPDNMAKSVEWYTFLQDRLGVTRPESLDVSVPDLNLVLRLDRPFKELKREVTAVEDDEGGDEEVVVTKVLDHAARSLIVRSLALLKEGSEWTEVLNYWQRNERMGLAWRRYDRIEWIFGENETKMYGTLAMQKTHELELRPKVHYPTEVQLEGKEVLEEPPPIEGFLVRLSTATGKSTRFGRIFFRRHYFYSQNHLLFFCKPAAAIPPPPPHLVSAEEMPEAEEIAEKTPLIYAVTPYALDEEGEIPWLSSTSSKEVHEKDHAAFTEGQRNVRNAIAADGFIDIRKIKMIKLVLKTQLGDTAEAVEEEGGWTGEDPHPDHIEDNLFDIILTNGLTLRLQAFNSATRDEWMTRLKALSLYWSARSLADSRELMSVRASNLRLHGCDEQSEYLLSQASRKWEVHNSLASPLLHTFCGISSCRTITHAGPLYLKARKHSTFRKVHAVLVHGNLLLYEANYRHPLSGVALPALAQMKHSTHPLQHVYLLSNLLTSASLLPSTTGGSATTTTTAGKPYTPRVYDDGVTSSDTDEQLAFCLWVAPQRVLVGDGKGGVKRVGALGREGSVKIFKARTRAERDMWVGALAVEIERGRGEEEWGIKGAEEDGMGMQRADTGIGGGGEEI